VSDHPIHPQQQPHGHEPQVESDIESILHQLLDVIGNARPMPLSASVMVNRDEVLEIIEHALTRVPEELRQARWLLREREDFLAKVQREGDDILDAARARAERMVQRTEVVRAAQHTARRVVEEAEAESRRLRHEAEDYCDHKLAQFEIVLDRTIKTVQAGRQRLHTPAGEEPQPQPRMVEPAPHPDPEVYDYDE